MNRIKFSIAILFIFAFLQVEGQIFINEVSNRNSGQVADEDGEFDDWIELINYSGSSANIENYYLSDDPTNPEKWKFPSYFMQPAEHLLVFASGKNRLIFGGFHWESPVLPEDNFSYLPASAGISSNWIKPGFDLSGWNTGRAGFGYGDNDDSTVIALGTMAVYIRRSFQLPAGFSFAEIALHVDFDDGFVAYLNGTEIARRNIIGTPTYNSGASEYREALMYSANGKPELIPLDTNLIKSILVQGENVFAIEVHNVAATSSDVSLIPFLSFLIGDSYSLFDQTPNWLIGSASHNLHTNFKIDTKGERISLFNKSNNFMDTIRVNNLSYGWSLGRFPNGVGSWSIFIEPTPSAVNSTKAYSINRETDPVFSIPEGYYSGTQSVSLSTSSTSAEIRFTIDGSEPTRSSSLYTGTPITVVTNKVVRACTFSKGDLLPGHSLGNTYFVNNAGHTVPVLSLIIKNSNLYGGTGIFDNWQQDWEKPAYVEFFDSNKKKVFEQFSGIQIDGGAGGSRSNPQHSFRLEFSNNSYGDGGISYPLLPDRPNRTDYKSIYLRNGSNQWLTFPFKDAMECSITANNTYNDYSHCTPVVVYINGVYFGLYEMREKLNDEYFEKNYKATVDSSFHLLSLSYWYNSILRAVNGSVDTFNNDYNKFISLAPAASDYLKKAGSILDIDYYTDYIIAQSWIADTDWPFNNIKIVKGGFTGNRWRFMLQDLEWALNPNGWTTSSTDHINYIINYDTNNPYLRFWKELMRNPMYKRGFINRFADIMNTSYLSAKTVAIAQAVYDSSYAEMYKEYVKWGGGTSQANSRMVQYASNMTIFKNELKNRSSVVRNNIVSNFGFSGQYSLELGVKPVNKGFIKINTITPVEYPWTGIYFSGNPITLEAKGIGNYVFDSWEPNTYISNIYSSVITVDPKASGYKFIANFKVQTPAQAIAISEINYSSSAVFPTSDWVELYNYGSSSTDLTGWYIRDEKADHKWVLLGSYIIKPGERLVLASDINNFNDTYPNVQNVMGSFVFGLGTPSDSVQLFNSANKLISGVKYRTTSPWPTGAFDLGMTLELKDPNSDINVAENWFAGCVGGSPGLPYTQCNALGLSSATDKFTAELYPNPATDEINLVLGPEMSNQNLSVVILDVMGKNVFQETFNAASQTELEIPISNLADGVYILQLSNGNYQQNLKFVKRKG